MNNPKNLWQNIPPSIIFHAHVQWGLTIEILYAGICLLLQDVFGQCHMPHIVGNRASMHITTGCGGDTTSVLLYSNGTKTGKHVNLKTNGAN